MARCSFFSFSYEDVKNFRVNVVRNSWLHHQDDQTFYDRSIWEEERVKTPTRIKSIIDEGLVGTSVTAVLIGSDTASRRYVKYELARSFERGNGILGVHINRIRDKYSCTAAKGLNPLDRFGFEISENGKKIWFYELINGRWYKFEDLPEINNKKSNTLYFEGGWFSNDFGKFFRFSDYFETYCWINDNGYRNYCHWVEAAAEDAGR
ncbi:TIR domain-containing protein [Mucilaginibacter flavus]|uniref:TIR domain-containing protein n=1 Tax=Mucilaginibacter flavus TaxID=931504 RepID=UPI0025B4C6E0|nr:TIR domain-containing protein [Mucilaginibacter flavus]MDN3582498.1 TIR domain-containing protein [Mucilaginibacter flavus]